MARGHVKCSMIQIIDDPWDAVAGVVFPPTLFFAAYGWTGGIMAVALLPLAYPAVWLMAIWAVCRSHPRTPPAVQEHGDGMPLVTHADGLRYRSREPVTPDASLPLEL